MHVTTPLPVVQECLSGASMTRTGIGSLTEKGSSADSHSPILVALFLRENLFCGKHLVDLPLGFKLHYMKH